MPSEELFRRTVHEAGTAIIGQTGDLAPADKRLYAIRDVTATVESIPLITASILSKKLAAGLDTLVLDVKVGNGAFMATADAAQELARSLVEVANGAGVKTAALLTDMNEPLADAAGNALEIVNCLQFLKGEKAATRLEAVVLALAAEMLVQGGMASNLTEGEAQARDALSSGRALERFARMVTLLGGPSDFIERSDAYLVKAPVVVPVLAKETGFLSEVDTRELGLAVVELGGGRRLATDTIDHRVGLSGFLPLGTQVEKGQPIAFVHAADDASAAQVAAKVAGLYAVADTAPATRPVILKRIG